MRAIQIGSLDGPEALKLVDLPDPIPSGDDVLIEVHAAGVTFPEVLQSRGLYQLKPDLPFTPGSEVAGVVRHAPKGSGLERGQRVIAFVGLGGFAEVCIGELSRVFALPADYSFVNGAALPMNYFTMHFAYFRRGNLRNGETVLVHGAAGGIGTAAIQLAKAHDCRVIAVVSSPEKQEIARKAGADDVISTDGFLAKAKELTGGVGVNLVVDPVGGDRFTDSLRSLAPEGRLLVIGFTGGEIPTVKVNRLLLNNTAVIGVGWGGYFLQQPGYLKAQWKELSTMLPKISPIIGATFPLARAADAVRELEQRKAAGKVVLQVR